MHLIVRSSAVSDQVELTVAVSLITFVQKHLESITASKSAAHSEVTPTE